MKAWAARHRRFLVFSASTLLLLLTLALVYALVGERVVGAAYEGRSIQIFNEYFRPKGGRSLARVQMRAHGQFHSLLYVALALWGLAAVAYFVATRPARRVRALAAGLCLWWLAVEAFIAPRLDFPLWIVLREVVRNPDHRPTDTTGEYNSDSLRGTPESAEFRPQDLNLLFLGDSFTFGAGVKPEESFVQRSTALLAESHPEAQIRAANFGWISSSPILSHRRLVDIGAKYVPDVVVECIDMTDFEDDLRYEHMLARDGLYWFYDKLPLTLRAWQKLSRASFQRALAWSVGGIPDRRFFATEAPLDETRPFLERLARNVEATAAWCREHGAEFVLVILPRSYQYSDREVPNNYEEAHEYVPLGEFVHEPFRYFEEYAERAPFPVVVSLLDDFLATDVFPTCFESDPHWNAAGHAIAAEGIARELAPIVARRLGN